MKTHKELLSRVFNEVIETLAFMFADEAVEEELPESPSGYLAASMSFEGPFNGELVLAVSKEMCPELAGNILGVEPDDERVAEKAEDALKELLNIVCGHVLTDLAGETPVFDLTVPTVQALAAPEWRALRAQEDTAFLVVDDYPVVLSLHVDTETS